MDKSKTVKVKGREIGLNDIVSLVGFQNVRSEGGRLAYDYELRLSTGESVMLPKDEGYRLEVRLRRRPRP